jgi:hypothetical protein
MKRRYFIATGLATTVTLVLPRLANAQSANPIYAVANNGDLLWYRHDGRNDGSEKWAFDAPKKVGNGWNFKQLFSGGNGIIYAVANNGDLLWYRHDGRNDGSEKWAFDAPKKIGNGWNFKQLFSG